MLFRSNDTATTEIYTLSLHDALPICMQTTYSLPGVTVWLVLPVLAGGLSGSYMGSRIMPMRGIALALSAVLLIAAFKLFYV